MRTMILGLAGLWGVMLGAVVAVATAAGPEGREIPESFVPFEHMIGSWKGQGIPTANRLKGWPEKHLWAWKFAKGAPVGMSLTLEGDKALTRATLTCDAVGKPYRLEGTDPEGKAVAYVGTWGGTSSSKMLTLDRVGETPAGKERLVLWPNSNRIRYALWLDRQDPGAPQFKRVIEVGLTKEGEAFAAGGSAADLPKCVITGGAAAMTITYQGKSYPLCCSGCRDEFNDNPEKYIKKAALQAEQGASKTPVKAAGSGVGKDDGAFAGFGDEERPRSKETPKPATHKADSAPGSEPADAPKADERAGKDEARASSLLRLGQNLEKSGKVAAALPYYRRIVKEYPGTASGKAAAARIKALGGD
jgi:YHS domain-containing protein